MADENVRVPKDDNHTEEDIPSELEETVVLKVTDTGKDSIASGSKESHIPSDDDNFLAVPSSSRPRSSSQVGRVVPDIVVIQPRQQEPPLPPLTTSIKHDRGSYMLPEMDPNFYPSDEYPKYGGEPGEVYIFNFETFLELSPREGTRLDVKALIETLGLLKFNVPENRIYNDLTKEEVMQSISTATNAFNADPDTKINCLIVVFLTHGLANNIICAKDEKMKIEDIIHAFCNCEALDKVPKWFTFLACKEKTQSDNRVEKQHKIVADNTYIKRLPEDVIVYYATTENNVSARVVDEGTWMIQELCSSLSRYGRRDELFTILTRTNKTIANNYMTDAIGHNDLGDPFRQCPVILSTLRKKFYLTISKDRKEQLMIMNKIQDMLTV
ncbi:caspase-6-like [Atheta coriaria]|uniref:caspase-6-like n=1 Tax=Dalotia coriaria TaxID=877792 RepID=UPI0031F43EDD